MTWPPPPRRSDFFLQDGIARASFVEEIRVEERLPGEIDGDLGLAGVGGEEVFSLASNSTYICMSYLLSLALYCFNWSFVSSNRL